MFGKKELDELGSAIDVMVEAWVDMTPKQRVSAVGKVREDDPRVTFWTGSSFVMDRSAAALVRAMLRGYPTIRVDGERRYKDKVTRCVEALARKKPAPGLGNRGNRGGVIGAGAYGVVVAHPTKTDRVVKAIPVGKNPGETLEGALKEAEIMKTAGEIGVSPKFHGVSACFSGDYPIMMFEMGAMKRTLRDWVLDGRSMDELDGMLSKIDKKVEKLHSVGIFHHDLHDENVMLDAKDQPFVVDYGLATQSRFSIDPKKYPAIKREHSYLLMQIDEHEDVPGKYSSFELYVAAALAGLVPAKPVN